MDIEQFFLKIVDQLLCFRRIKLIPLSQGRQYVVWRAVRRRSAASAGEHWVARARSLSEFQTSFPDETSCAAFLFERRWPPGVCLSFLWRGTRSVLEEPGAHLRMPRLRSPDVDNGRDGDAPVEVAADGVVLG